MFTTTRYFYPHGNEAEAMDNTVKEFDTMDKAIKYAHRYATGIRFAGVEITNENGELVYEITTDGTVTDNREAMNKILDFQSNNEEASKEFTELAIKHGIHIANLEKRENQLVFVKEGYSKVINGKGEVVFKVTEKPVIYFEDEDITFYPKHIELVREGNNGYYYHIKGEVEDTDCSLCFLAPNKINSLIELHYMTIPNNYDLALRVCSQCGKPMTSGYCINGGEDYYCSDECLHENMTEEEYLELYNDGNGESYWTEWE